MRNFRQRITAKHTDNANDLGKPDHADSEYVSYGLIIRLQLQSLPVTNKFIHSQTHRHSTLYNSTGRRLKRKANILLYSMRAENRKPWQDAIKKNIQSRNFTQEEPFRRLKNTHREQYVMVAYDKY